ncbi:hypothetical protein DSO57_1002572 [Entomophthora muscae]|uniref:Uncharacterized protein n=1 Tax=Entomophthora muscae TaxID=34485 RepID=A0ACC2U7A1_9FUNG|nr:hypothetical protein DSO57_1002572 [Entomophthora muscae]
MAFEPVIVTNGSVVVACNAGASELFGYQSQDGLVGQGVRSLIDGHFEPSVVIDADGGVRKASERDLVFAKVKNENSVKKGAIVKTKEWKHGGNCFYTITIVDISILRIANSKRMLQPKMGILDVGVGAKHQTALFNNLSQMADALPSLIWVASQGGELLYQNRRVKDVFGVDTITECWQVSSKLSSNG